MNTMQYCFNESPFDEGYITDSEIIDQLFPLTYTKGNKTARKTSEKGKTNAVSTSEVPAEILAAMQVTYDDAVARTQDYDLDNLEENALKTRIKFIDGLRNLKKTGNDLKDLAKLSKAMDESHQGMRFLKDELLAQASYAIRTGITPTPILLVGEPGCGKTSLAISFAKALGHGYNVLSLGGAIGSFPINGSDVGWKAAKEGKIMDTFLNAKCLNPVIILDEIDKMALSQQQGTPADALLPVLEKEQARMFKDNYLDFPYDISGAWIILTANYLSQVPEPILDRCHVIQMPVYDLKMKEDIFQVQVRKKNKEIAPSSITVNNDVLKFIVTTFCGDAGARGVSKCVNRLFEQTVKDFPRDGAAVEKRLSLTDAKRMFPKQPMDLHFDFAGHPGLVPGLAVNTIDFSGLILPVEATVSTSPYREETITGLVQPMMRESVTVAISIAERMYGKPMGRVSVNYPFPIPKDGDSAGLATTIAVLSAARNQPVREKTAITGSVSLSAQVLPVGGIMAKVRAAIDKGYKDVIIPKGNEKDWMELPEREKKAITAHLVKTVEEAVSFLFE